jgi:hypothetical protein
MTKKSDKLAAASDTQIWVYGLDEAGKPKGARFAASDSEKVLSIAKAMNLQSCQDCSEQIEVVGMKLPLGRIWARGKAFVPNIKRDLYDKLLAAIGSSAGPHDRTHVERTVAAPATPSGGAAHVPIEATTVLPPLASGLPQNWESIAPGNMILVDAGPGEGWWEALVVSRDEAILTLRYRDYPKLPLLQRHVATVALINPRPA